MGKKITLTEAQFRSILKCAMNEFLDRDTMNKMTSLGIKDPTDKYTVNADELKQKCAEIYQKCNDFLNTLKSFEGYVDGVEEDVENGVSPVDGVRHTMRLRNMFGARNLKDEYLEQDLNDLSDVIWKAKSAVTNLFEQVEYMSK